MQNPICKDELDSELDSYQSFIPYKILQRTAEFSLFVQTLDLLNYMRTFKGVTSSVFKVIHKKNIRPEI